MSSISERINRKIRKYSEEQRPIDIELAARSRNLQELARINYSQCTTAIDLIGAESLLNEVNKNNLRRKGEIEKYDGKKTILHGARNPEYGDKDEYEYIVTSLRKLTWSVKKWDWRGVTISATKEENDSVESPVEIRLFSHHLGTLEHERWEWRGDNYENIIAELREKFVDYTTALLILKDPNETTIRLLRSTDPDDKRTLRLLNQ